MIDDHFCIVHHQDGIKIMDYVCVKEVIALSLKAEVFSIYSK